MDESEAEMNGIQSTEPAAKPMLARDLDAHQLGILIRDGVYYGAMKAIGVYLLISAAVGLLVWIIASGSQVE